MRKKKLFKLLSIGLASVLAFSTLIGCSNSEEKKEKEVQAQKEVASKQEVNQNDYRGGYTRIGAIQKKVVEIVNNFNVAQNKEIIQQNPSSYWNDENFVFFTNDFLKNDDFHQTQYFNELETEWTDVETYTKALFIDANGNYIDPHYSGISIEHIGTNDYSLGYNWTGLPPYCKSQTYALQMKYKLLCTYDSNHDWLQYRKSAKADLDKWKDLDITEDLIEYGRQKATNSFVIQYPMERLYITYETLEGTEENQYNPLENAKITSFAYSKLSGKKLPYYTEKELELIEEGILTDGIQTENVSDEGDITYQYSLRDSIFPHFTDITADWVLEYPIEEGYYDKYIVFDGSNMTIYNQNKMSNQMEIIEFHSDGSIQDRALSLQETLTPFTLHWVNSDGTLTGDVDLWVNETYDLVDEEGNVLIPSDKAVYNSDNRVIVDDAFLSKMGLLEETPTEPTEPTEIEEDDNESSEDAEKTE